MERLEETKDAEEAFGRRVTDGGSDLVGRGVPQSGTHVAEDEQSSPGDFVGEGLAGESQLE